MQQPNQNEDRQSERRDSAPFFDLGDLMVSAILLAGVAFLYYLTAHFEERVGDLTQGANGNRIHQYFEDIAIGDDRVFEPLQHQLCVTLMSPLKATHTADLVLLFVIARTS